MARSIQREIVAGSKAVTDSRKKAAVANRRDLVSIECVPGTGQKKRQAAACP